MEVSHVVALQMFPTMAIKLATSTGLCLLTVCTSELVAMERRKILMLSVTVWARGWFVWAPTIFMLKVYDTILPLTMFASLSVIGGTLMCIVNHSLEIKRKKRPVNNIKTHTSICDDTTERIWFVRFSKNSYDLKNTPESWLKMCVYCW